MLNGDKSQSQLKIAQNLWFSSVFISSYPQGHSRGILAPSSFLSLPISLQSAQNAPAYLLYSNRQIRISLFNSTRILLASSNFKSLHLTSKNAVSFVSSFNATKSISLSLCHLLPSLVNRKGSSRSHRNSHANLLKYKSKIRVKILPN